MKVITTISSLSNLNSIIDLIDGVMVGNSDFATNLNVSFTNEELEKILHFCVLNNKLMFLKIDLYMESKDIEKVTNFIKKFIDNHIYYVGIDIGVYQILKDLNLEHHFIYDNPTMIANKEDFNFLASLNMHASSMSYEIPFKDVIISKNYSSLPMFYKVFGYQKMFHSKRKLLSLYEEYSHTSIDRSNLSLKEALRNDKYKIIEDNHGTTIFRHYPLCYLKEALLFNKIDYIFLDSLNISDDLFLKILNIYLNTINNKIMVEDAFDLYLDLNLDYEDGFIYLDTVYQKEEF